MTIRPLTMREAEHIAHRLAYELMNSDHEPIPPFSMRQPGRLESCLAEPFATFGGRYLHRTFEERAAVLFYLITKNHCFENGNKRMAVTLTTVFFFVNRRWINISPMEMYELATDVAESSPKDRGAVHKMLVDTFRWHRAVLPSGTA